MNSDFTSTYSFEHRLSESNRIREKYNNRIPVICQRSIHAARNCPLIDKKKYLIPHDLSVGQFIYVIRSRLKLAQNTALFIFINGVMPPISGLMSKLDSDYKNRDGFLYVYYNLENTFGNQIKRNCD